MNQKERLVIAGSLVLIAFLVAMDVFNDLKIGVASWHVLLEVGIGLSALLGVFYLMRGSVILKHRLEKEIREFSDYKKEAELWRADSRKFLDGLSKAIDQQLTKWNLTVSEKEVAFLLLKGLSLKEIAEVRQTTEKTARAQSTAIYAKAGLSGRSELSAFFLEDLFLPTNEIQN